MASLVAICRAAPLVLAAACRAGPLPVRSSPEWTLAARIAGCYALAFADPNHTAAPQAQGDRVNLASHTYVELVGPSPKFTYGQIAARPALDSAATDYVRPAWVPLPPDSVVVLWTHVWTPVATLEARLGVLGDSLVGSIRVATDVPTRPGSPGGAAAVARRTQCRTGARSPGT